MALEIIPIDQAKARRKEPMRLEVYDIELFPAERFEITFDWNEYMDRWIVTFTHLGTDTRFYKGPADLYQDYVYDDIVAFMFIDPATQETVVKPENLGDTVWLAVLEVS